MSDESLAQPEETVTRAELEHLQEQLKAIRADRDRQNFERAEIVAKANAYARERDEFKAQRDELKEQLAAAVADRDRFAQEKASAAALAQNLTRHADDATRRADEAAEEIARLRAAIQAAPPADPLALLLALAQDKTKAGVAWLRSKIPADSPMLPWFDKTVETVTMAGCMAVRLTREFVAWATPRVVALSKQGVAKVEELLAKK